ncbi:MULTISPECIES: hypothetical protein [unclassified Streptomyces]|uniref:hypothetical protein n=1 Tax=unclassified Streptomyces TaxID=2593676 RepID=UPI00343E8FE4
MTTTQQALRTGKRALTVGALAVFLAVTAPVAAAAAAPHTTVPADSAAAQARAVFNCAEVEPDPPKLFARQCIPGHWGPISDFDVVDRRTNARYRCQSGWAEGTL